MRAPRRAPSPGGRARCPCSGGLRGSAGRTDPLAGSRTLCALAGRRSIGASSGAPSPAPPGSSSAARRRSSCLTSFGCTVKPSGVRSSCVPSSRKRSAGTAVCTSGEGERSSWYSPVPLAAEPCSAAAAIFAFRRWWSVVRLSHTPCPSCSICSLETTPSAISRSPHSSATRLCPLIFAYISGWV